ncbi:MAG: lactonase family protein [Planctomycetes bacterium]|nr:lactonase family protein [Planctomycetota bacterium]
MRNGLWALGFVMVALAGIAQADDAGTWVYVGTYTGGESKGIYQARLNPTTGALTGVELAAEIKNPSFLAIHPNRKFLYAVSEVSDAGGKPTGGVVAFAIDQQTGKLKLLNQQVSAGAGPCHLVVDKAGKNVLVANYGGGSCTSLPIAADGSLQPASSAIQHTGKSVNASRQEGPHAHSINLDAANKFAFVADLGLDQVLVYRFDPAAGRLVANQPPHVAVAPGSGPRHFALSPSGKTAYVINELANTVTVLSYDAERGVLQELQTITTLPADFSGTSYTAEVVVHPSGKFVYGSNRGHDSLAIFTADGATGKLTARGHQKTGGKTPRNFAIDPSGKWLLAENQDSGTIVVFQINPETGELKQAGQPVAIPFPVCVRFR